MNNYLLWRKDNKGKCRVAENPKTHLEIRRVGGRRAGNDTRWGCRDGDVSLGRRCYAVRRVGLRNV